MAVYISGRYYRVGGQIIVPSLGNIGYASYQGATTGGAGGEVLTATTLAQLTAALESPLPKVVYLEGNIYGGSTNSNYGITTVGGNKSIFGKPGSSLNGIGIYFKNDVVNNKNGDNCIIKNVKFNPHFAGSVKRDLLSVEGGASRIHISHCEFSSNPTYNDGSLDLSDNADFVTVDHCKFTGAMLTSLAGSGGDVNKNRFTFAFNYWLNNMERNPSCAHGKIHVLNSLYEHINPYPTETSFIGYGIGSRNLAIVRADSNYFKNYKGNPLATINSSGTVPYGQFSGISTNFRDATSLNHKLNGVVESTWIPPYDYSGYLLPVMDVPAYVYSNAGQTLTLSQIGL